MTTEASTGFGWIKYRLKKLEASLMLMLFLEWILISVFEPTLANEIDTQRSTKKDFCSTHQKSLRMNSPRRVHAGMNGKLERCPELTPDVPRIEETQLTYRGLIHTTLV